MTLSGNSGAGMALLQLLLFETMETDTKRAAGRRGGDVSTTGVACPDCRERSVRPLQETPADALGTAASAVPLSRSSAGLTDQDWGESK